ENVGVLDDNARAVSLLTVNDQKVAPFKASPVHPMSSAEVYVVADRVVPGAGFAVDDRLPFLSSLDDVSGVWRLGSRIAFADVLTGHRLRSVHHQNRLLAAPADV